MNDLILNHISLANNLAKKKKKAIFSVAFDELQSAAYMGLCEAAVKFNPKYGEFTPYASIRINGAIQDYLRELGWGPRGNLWKKDFNYQLI